MNYENTGELGAEMGGKPVQHGLEVPPNAVRRWTAAYCRFSDGDPGSDPGALSNTVLAAPMRADTHSAHFSLELRVQSSECRTQEPCTTSRRLRRCGRARSVSLSIAQRTAAWRLGLRPNRTSIHARQRRKTRWASVVCAGVGHAVGEHHGQGPVHAARGRPGRSESKRLSASRGVVRSLFRPVTRALALLLLAQNESYQSRAGTPWARHMPGAGVAPEESSHTAFCVQ